MIYGISYDKKTRIVSGIVYDVTGYTETDIVGFFGAIRGANRELVDFIFLDQLPLVEHKDDGQVKIVELSEGEILPEDLVDVRDRLPETLEQKAARLETELAQTKAALNSANETNLTTMSALAEVFEMVLALQDQIAAGTGGTGA
ncbi:hypothetical protein [Paenibacillus naphthalenovorans]|uniref:hypothetical protein n=1 Tax=Paenibacillus naphthalenovorans TaxID=162209 RepID=UPI00088838C8|nr:hypothetical protein [Paenibacillus naphthalenovorans]SDI48829.1 hypothetical protein SAMN05421868_10712 [Paenibacillus naphthalenovorans]